MEIKIKLTKHEVNHIHEYHTFYDCCEEVETIMKKVQKAIISEKNRKEKK